MDSKIADTISNNRTAYDSALDELVKLSGKGLGDASIWLDASTLEWSHYPYEQVGINGDRSGLIQVSATRTLAGRGAQALRLRAALRAWHLDRDPRIQALDADERVYVKSLALSGEANLDELLA